jgi:hypothetical protein
MKNITITILTDPLCIGINYFKEPFRLILQIILRILNRSKLKYYNHPIYRGHFAVTRSLVEGFRKNNISFIYNRLTTTHSEYVVVLSNVIALRQCIKLKKLGLIKVLFAGPNICNSPSDHNYILTNKYIDKIIIPSKWVSDYYCQISSKFSNRLLIWPAGVDEMYWIPNKYDYFERDKILLYKKRINDDMRIVFDSIVNFFQINNISYNVIEYGTFTQDEYLDLLRNSKLMIGFSKWESQGIAWSEAWSVNVPTFIYKVDSTIIDNIKLYISSAPYLSETSGLYFNGFTDFKNKFNEFENRNLEFNPRNYVYKNLTDVACSKILYDEFINHA